MAFVLGGKDKKDKRFVVTHKEGSMSVIEVIVDTQTGVNYIFRSSGYAGGMTPLLDANGKPVITPISSIYDEE